MIENTSEGYESSIVSKFIKDLREGKSFLQEKNDGPSYVSNIVTGKIYTGVNMILANQAAKDKGKFCPYVVTQSQIGKRCFYLDKGTKALGIAIYDNYDAYYKKSDMEVYTGLKSAGEQKLDANGNPIDRIIISYLYDASEIYKPFFEPEHDEQGLIKHYEENVYAIEDGQIKVHQRDYSFRGRDGEMVYIKKGDPILLHKKGSLIGHYRRSEEPLYKENGNILIPYIIGSDLHPLYKRQSEDGREILTEKMCEAFRGKLMGRYEGLKITNDELDKIEQSFLSHPRSFRSALKEAHTRAMGDENEIQMLDEKIKAYREQKMDKDDSFKQFHQLSYGR